MRHLFLFFTSAEGGAPGYLSRKGETAANALAQTLYQFASESLSIDFAAGYDERAQNLEGDLRWRLLREQNAIPQARTLAYELFSRALLFCGDDIRSLKTMEPLATQTALPIVVDSRLDKSSESRPKNGVLGEALVDIASWIGEKSTPSLVFVGTSLEALHNWAKPLVPELKAEALYDILYKTSQDGSLPTVLACGLEVTKENDFKWLFDL